MRKNGKASSGPAKKADGDGIAKIEMKLVQFIKREKKATKEKINTSLSGITLCLISYTEITINIEKIKVKKTTRNKYMIGEKNIIGIKW